MKVFLLLLAAALLVLTIKTQYNRAKSQPLPNQIESFWPRKKCCKRNYRRKNKYHCTKPKNRC